MSLVCVVVLDGLAGLHRVSCASILAVLQEVSCLSNLAVLALLWLSIINPEGDAELPVSYSAIFIHSNLTLKLTHTHTLMDTHVR